MFCCHDDCLRYLRYLMILNVKTGRNISFIIIGTGILHIPIVLTYTCCYSGGGYMFCCHDDRLCCKGGRRRYQETRLTQICRSSMLPTNTACHMLSDTA